MYYWDRGCWAARVRVARTELRGRASLKGGDSDARAKREKDGNSPARFDVGAAGSDRPDVRLLRLGRTE